MAKVLALENVALDATTWVGGGGGNSGMSSHLQQSTTNLLKLVVDLKIQEDLGLILTQVRSECCEH